MKHLISIIGTTGIGKTRLAIELAQIIKSEIISCDSRQFFKEMKIGTAAPSDEELSVVPHHFIGHLSVEDYYSIGQYEHDALLTLDQLFNKNKTQILVGGSMMYEKALIEGLHQLPEANVENLQKLEEIFHENGIEELQKLLSKLDPEYYNKVDIHNSRRLIRAIDVIWQTQKTYTENIASAKINRDFQVTRIGIQAPREIIYQKINQRVDLMMKNGLWEEAQPLFELKKLQSHLLPSLNTVGYTELFKVIEGEWTLDFAVEEIKKNSRRFAKRQLTWYRKEEEIIWVNYENPLQECVSLLRTKNVI